MGIGASVGIVSALVPIVRGNWGAVPQAAPLSKNRPKVEAKASAPSLSSLDLLHLEVRAERVIAQIPSRTGGGVDVGPGSTASGNEPNQPLSHA